MTYPVIGSKGLFKKMKVSDYIINFLAEKGVTHFFGMSGGAAVHLFDSVDRNPKTQIVCSQHEQSAAISADGYARVTGKLGVAITTSGPGATNLLTGVCCSFYDSVPTLMLTGQVSRARLRKGIPVRQLGFQETDVVSIFQTVTKYCHQVLDASEIRYHLEKAYHFAFDGRPGTVLLDIPDDLQREQIDPEKLVGFRPDVTADASQLTEIIQKIQVLVDASSRPLFVLGGGLSTPRIAPDLIEAVITAWNIPVIVSWAGVDVLRDDHPLKIGTFGVYGPRFGNFAVQNADLLICIGTRLSQNLTGGILKSFAREAKIVMVDADAAEMDKFDSRGIDVTYRFKALAKNFFEVSQRILKDYQSKARPEWHAKLTHWKNIFPISREKSPLAAGSVDAYEFIEVLNEVLRDGELVFVDTGGNLTWTLNGIKTRSGQRIMSAWNNTPMGYSLPAAIGAAFANPQSQVTCIIGDGGLMICLSELATIVKHKLNIKLILFNNHAHGIQKQTLETWLDGRYVGVHGESGLAFPDFIKVAKAFDLATLSITDIVDCEEKLRTVYDSNGPVFCNIEINPNQKLYPVVKFGAALENQMPSLESEQIETEMLVKPFQNG